MGKAHRPWKELEGQRLRIDVGSTKEEALASQENSTIYFTKDKSIVMNGVAFSDNKETNTVYVNVLKSIPTRPRKGQIYFFRGRVVYRLKRNLMRSGEVFNMADARIVMGIDNIGGVVFFKSPSPYPNITKDNWAGYFGNVEEIVVVVGYESGHFAVIEKDGFVGDAGVVSIYDESHFNGMNVVPKSPNFEIFKEFTIPISKENSYEFRIRCIADVPYIDEDSFSRRNLALFTIKRRKRFAVQLHGYRPATKPIKSYDKMPSRAELSRKYGDYAMRKKFFICATIKRGMVSEKKAFVTKYTVHDAEGFETNVYKKLPMRG